MESTIAQTVDTKGLNCPIPILRAKKAIVGLEAGEVLEVLATDPGSVKDFEAFSRATGHELMESTEDGGVFRFLVKKAP
jgi:tRNA 2-thiouridine synthesizing protein A